MKKREKMVWGERCKGKFQEANSQKTPSNLDANHLRGNRMVRRQGGGDELVNGCLQQQKEKKKLKK